MLTPQKQGLLLLAHGSPNPGMLEELEALTHRVMSRFITQYTVTCARLSFGNPNLSEGLEYLLQEGCLKIQVIPLFLFQGKHVQVDIPQCVTEFLLKNPQVDIRVADHIFEWPGFLELLQDQIQSEYMRPE